MVRSPSPRSAALKALPAATLLFVAACGGGGADVPAAASSASGPANALSGTVAVGAPITSGKLRIVDAAGAVVASDVSVDADGRYAAVALSGPAPYRIEACGQAGPNYLCVYSVASAAGTANVTPLTTATVLLAAAQSPDALMGGAATALTAESVATAQTQLRSSLASVLSSAGVSSSFDFVSGALAAGSRTAYDGVLDAVGVKLGEDGAQPFVQITPRLGSGNLYLTQGQSLGTLTAAPAAATLQLGGIETLFRNMSTAVASPSACANGSTGMQASLAADAQLSIDGPVPAQGAAAVAEALCTLFAGGEDMEPMWGATFLSPTLGKCDLSGAVPLCGVSFVLKLPDDGGVLPVGTGMAVTQEAGVWKFHGDLAPIGLSASARAQRTRRIDTTGAPLDYARAFAFEVAAAPGVACARVSQRDADGNSVTLAYYKRHSSNPEANNLSLWTADGFSQGASLNPLAGATRSDDDTWLALPTGTAGDAVIRNFYRGGRSVVMSLYADSACATPHVIAGKSEFDVEVEGVPPLWAAMENLPWPELEAGTSAALSALTLDADATGSLSVAWTFARGPLGLGEATVCGDQATCGGTGGGRLANHGLRAGARSATIALRNGGPALAVDSEKMLALNGRNGEGVAMQSNYLACPTVPAGQSCR